MSEQLSRKSHWIGTGMKALTFLLLISVITSNFFHLPIYDETGKSTVIVMAMMIFTLSTVFDGAKNK